MRQQTLRRMVVAAALLATATATHVRSQRAVVQPLVDASAQEAIGAGSIWAMLGCAGCVAGALGVVAGGPGAILVYLNTPGNVQIAAGCIGVCYNALN